MINSRVKEIYNTIKKKYESRPTIASNTKRADELYLKEFTLGSHGYLIANKIATRRQTG